MPQRFGAGRMPPAVPFREVRHEQPEDFLHLEAIEVRGLLHDWRIPAHRHEGLHQFQWLSSGSARVVLDLQEQTLAAPWALMVAPGTVHQFDHEPGSRGQQVTLPTRLLREAFAGVSVLAAGLNRSLLLQPQGRDLTQLSAGFDQLAEEYASRQPGRSEALRAQSFTLAMWFLRRAAQAGATSPQQALRATLVRRFQGLLEEHFSEHWTIRDYADALQVSADHLSKACRSVTGESALCLVQDRVLAEARRLLAFSAVPVQRIALELGFEDANHFSRFFARRAGQSPSAYRAAAGVGLSSFDGAAPGAPVRASKP